MGGDDFQKKDSGLGLRDAITNKRQSIDSAASKRAHELFDEMKIIQAVTNAIGGGKSVVEIQFPSSMSEINPSTPFSGKIKWTTVIERFTKLIQAEGVKIKVQTVCDQYEFKGTNPPRYSRDDYFSIILEF